MRNFFLIILFYVLFFDSDSFAFIEFKQSKNISSDTEQARGINFKPDGTIMYITNRKAASGAEGQKGQVTQYSLSTPFDISTAKKTSQTDLLGSNEATVLKYPHAIEFKGLNGGKLLYSIIIEEQYSNSKLIIEDFKVVNAPGMIKLLSLADLGGLADLAQGAGLTFDILEIKMEKRNDNLKIDEILALGPSVSILMEGYQNKDITSLRGTLVPAKTLNKLISKIPLIGDIVIPKEVGEGLFGVSFKMKGPPGKIKTTINPIRTITPRFIQKIIDKNKKKSK